MRLLSVCWYSSDLVFAGNAASCILRFSRGGPQQPFVADGKMVLESQPIAGAPAESERNQIIHINYINNKLIVKVYMCSFVFLLPKPPACCMQHEHYFNCVLCVPLTQQVLRLSFGISARCPEGPYWSAAIAEAASPCGCCRPAWLSAPCKFMLLMCSTCKSWSA